MIYADNLKKVSKALTERANKYERLSQEYMSEEYFCGFSEGMADSSDIARTVIDTYSSGINRAEYISLWNRLGECCRFNYVNNYSVSPDFLEGFKCGRERGWQAPFDLLELFKPDDWSIDDKEKPEETDKQEDA